jgi:hypothetical protein
MRVNHLGIWILAFALIGFVVNPLFVGTAAASPVTLPSGLVLDLEKQQVDVIKEQPGVFFGAYSTDLLSPGDIVIGLPDDLGGGYIYGRPDHLAQAFAAAGVIKGTTVATHLFVKRRSCLWF